MIRLLRKVMVLVSESESDIADREYQRFCVWFIYFINKIPQTEFRHFSQENSLQRRSELVSTPTAYAVNISKAKISWEFARYVQSQMEIA